MRIFHTCWTSFTGGLPLLILVFSWWTLDLFKTSCGAIEASRACERVAHVLTGWTIITWEKKYTTYNRSIFWQYYFSNLLGSSQYIYILTIIFLIVIKTYRSHDVLFASIIVYGQKLQITNNFETENQKYDLTVFLNLKDRWLTHNFM